MSARGRARPGSGWLLVWVLILAMGSGVAAGLVVSWWLWPVEYTDVSPDTLHPYHRAEYIVLISHAYAHDKDLRRAQVRLAALGDLGSVGVEVVTLAEQYAAQGRDLEDTQSLARLAHVLGHRRAALAPFMPGGVPTATWTPWPTATATATESPTQPPTATTTPTVTSTVTPQATDTSQPLGTPTARITVPAESTPLAESTPPVTPEPSPTPLPTTTRRATRTPRPTLTPTVTATPEPRFELSRQQMRCTEETAGLLMVTVLDAEAQPLPNIELIIRWQSGEDRFFTGLKPEKGVGYADYELSPGERYQVGIVGLASEVAQEMVADACADGTPASWDLVFRLRGSGP